MDEIKRRILQNNRKHLVDDLDAAHILDNLYSKDVLNVNEYESLRNKKTQRDKTGGLLDLIEKKDNRAFDNFVLSLKDDYVWLYEGFLHCLQNGAKDEIDEQVFIDAMVLGDLPKLPPHYVNRINMLQELRTKLSTLKANEKIVLHGMLGCGKSCLAAAAIEDKIFLKYFHHKVFWINLENYTGDNNILQMHLFRLYLRASDDDAYIPKLTSDTTQSIEFLKVELTKLFRKKNSLKEALLILDNVQSKDVVNAFDIGCKILITTVHADIVDTKLHMKVADSFNENETMKLFASCLNINQENLPEEAYRIYHLCKGYPLLIALVGSVLEASKEDAVHKTTLWKSIIEKLTKRDYDKLNRKEKMFAAISLCIEKLTPEYRNYYKDLVVFVEEVNIMPEVLQILWEKDSLQEVREIMIEFERMSLVVSYYSKELNSYVYGIHNIHLAYLKSLKNKLENQQLHAKLIKAYEKRTSNDFSKLPCDNYILQYLGYHLREAEMYDKFKVYFELNFLGAKIKAAGFADVLADFKTYQKYITNNDEVLQEKLEEYVKFIDENGSDLCKYPNTDIIQYALQQNKNSTVYKAAMQVVDRNPSKLYFQLLSPQERRNFERTLEVEDTITAACCTDDMNNVLVGNDNGLINMWEQSYQHKLCTFTGHESEIKYLQLSPEKDEFLSVSDDGKVKLWNFGRTYHHNNIFNGQDEYHYSPRLKQGSHHTFFGDTEKISRSITFQSTDIDDKLISAAFSNNYIETNLIVTGSERGKVTTWNTKTKEIIHNITPRGYPASCVTFSFDDSVIIYSCNKNILFYNAVIDSEANYLFQINNGEAAKLLIAVPQLDNKLVIINEQCIYIVQWKRKLSSVPQKTELVRSKDSSYTCGAVTEDGKYLVVGSTDYYIRMWDLNSKEIIEQLKNDNGLSVCLDTFYEGNRNCLHMLLVGSNDKTIQQWYLQPNLNETPVIKNLQVYSAYWKNTSQAPVLLIAVANTDKRIQILNGYKLLIETEQINSVVTSICFSLCGNKIAYGLENGSVIVLNYKTKQYYQVMSLHGAVKYLNYFDCEDSENTNGFDRNPGLLVAAAENGWLMIYRNNMPFCLRGPVTDSAIKQVPILPIVKCFYSRNGDTLLTVCENRTISVWNLSNGMSCTVLVGHGVNNSHVTTIALSNDGNYLAVGLASKTIEIYKIERENNWNCSLFQNKTLNTIPKCCAFSFDSKILAIGEDNGNIIIWSIEANKVLETLQLHQNSVLYLTFSPRPDLILISIGDQCAWWDLNKINMKASSRRSSVEKSKRQLPQLEIFDEISRLNLGFWSRKRASTEKNYLLASVKLHSNYNKSISCSNDFTMFVTINNDGKLDILQAI